MTPVFAFDPPRGFGPLDLGAERAVARAAMAAAGFPLESSNGDVDYYCDASIQTECGENGRIRFIGVACSPRFSAIYRGTEVFAVSAPDLFALFAATDDSGPHEYQSYEYCFPRQILTLWDADPQYDRFTNESKPVWGQVGIGNADYVAAIEKIRGESGS